MSDTRIDTLQFQPDLMRAIRDGRKTQLRRPCAFPLQFADRVAPGDLFRQEQFAFIVKDTTILHRPCPYGQPGDPLEAGRLDPSEGPPLHLRIEAVRVERLQSISATDILAEGIGWEPHPEKGHAGEWQPHPCLESRRSSYQEWWDHIHAERGYAWTEDPWVWVIAFALLRPAPPINPDPPHASDAEPR